MKNQNTIELLKECDAGTKMAVASIDEVLDFVHEGCNMGVKSLYKYRNQYEDADKKALDICDRLIKIEEKLCEGMHPYL